MRKVIADITMSLDGFVTGPGTDDAHVADIDKLHAWVIHQDDVDTQILERTTGETGAVVMGRRLFDVVDAPGGWSREMGYGAQQVGTPPFFVVTHSPPEHVRLQEELGLRCTFVPDLAPAVEQAGRAAEQGGHVVIMGGGDVIGQAIEQGLVDELRLHLAPVLLGGGTPLFRPGAREQYRQVEVRPSTNAVHLIYERVADPGP